MNALSVDGRRLLWSVANEGGKFVYKSVSGVFEVNPNIAGKRGGGGGYP